MHRHMFLIPNISHFEALTSCNYFFNGIYHKYALLGGFLLYTVILPNSISLIFIHFLVGRFQSENYARLSIICPSESA